MKILELLLKKSFPKRDISDIKFEKPSDLETPEGMVWIPGGILTQSAGENDQMAMDHEKPSYIVAVDGFFMDATQITNIEFKKFVDVTGYVTVAEREIDGEEMKTTITFWNSKTS